MPSRILSLRDRVRSSLFFVPMLFVIGAVVLGELLLVVDAQVKDVPEHLTATVSSARNVLTVIAGATLAFAGIAFSVSLLLISLSSSQYSPRVVHGLFRDPFNKRIMGIVIGTFTYCLVVMRVVRGPLEEGGRSIVPSISILVAVAFGIVSVLAIVAFINHSAHAMDVSKILHRVTAEALTQIRITWTADTSPIDHQDFEPPSDDSFAVMFDSQGWVQYVDLAALLAAADPGGLVRLETVAGRYAIPGTPLCTMWPQPASEEAARQAARAAVTIGESRTMQQDATYGVRQLADVALKALSPGINDPTTAQDALFHMGSVVRELLIRTPPPRWVSGEEGRRLLQPQAVDHDELVGLAFDEVRLASRGQPDVQIYILEILHLLSKSLAEHHRPDAEAALRRQADLTLEVSDDAQLPELDHERVRAAHRRRFLA